jgi:hypothetical protein
MHLVVFLLLLVLLLLELLHYECCSLMSLLLLFFPRPCQKSLLDSSGPWKQTFCIPKCQKSLPVILLHSPVLENSGPCSQARSPSCKMSHSRDRHTFLALGMQKVSFQGPEEFSDMGECEKDLWVAGKMSWYQQRDCQSLVMEFSDGKLKQKGFFHSVGASVL